MSCQVISLDSYRKSKGAQEKGHRNRILSKLSLMRALIGVYEQDMLRVADDPQVLALCAEKNMDARTQIAGDVARLYELECHLRQCVFEKGAVDLIEASQLIRFWAPLSVIETLDQLLASSYPGFQKMADLLCPDSASDASQLESY